MLRAVASGGGGGGTATGFSITVATYADLPSAALYTGQDAQVLTTTGVPFVNRHMKGIYYSDGVSWIYVGPIDTDEDSQIQVSAGQRLLGRYAATAGTVQEITISTGLSLDSGTGALTATGTGGTVTTTGSPASGNLTKFSGASSITNGDLSGDITTSGTLATTLATVNSNVGSFGSSTSIPSFTVNGKGLITAASGNVVIAPAGTLTGTTLASNVITSSLTTVGTLINLTVTNTITGSISGNAATVTTNANLTGPITSVGNATSIASQTGTGTKFVVDTSPTLVTPNIGAATGASLQLSSLTASSSVATDGSKNLVSVTNTGTGNNVLATAPTLSGAVLGTSFANGLIFSATAAPSYTAGKLVYDQDNESLTFFNNDNLVGLQIGQEEWIRVKNVSGSSIPNGSAVYINGASAGLPTIALAQANAAATTIGAGLATETIGNNTIGYVTCIGVVHGLDTSAFSAGATLFISSTVAGGLVSTAPVAPNYRYRIGIVGTSSATVGTIHVTPSTAALGNGTANQLFGMNTAGTAQEVKSIVAGSNITVTPGTNTITIASTGGGSTSTGLVVALTTQYGVI